MNTFVAFTLNQQESILDFKMINVGCRYLSCTHFQTCYACICMFPSPTLSSENSCKIVPGKSLMCFIWFIIFISNYVCNNHMAGIVLGVGTKFSSFAWSVIVYSPTCVSDRLSRFVDWYDFWLIMLEGPAVTNVLNTIQTLHFRRLRPFRDLDFALRLVGTYSSYVRTLMIFKVNKMSWEHFPEVRRFQHFLYATKTTANS